VTGLVDGASSKRACASCDMMLSLTVLLWGWTTAEKSKGPYVYVDFPRKDDLIEKVSFF
jgi:hypothetical protein